MARRDALERVNNLLLALLQTNQPLTLEQLTKEVDGYEGNHEARRTAFIRDKALLEKEGAKVEMVSVPGNAQYGYRINPDTFYLPALDLDPREQAALNLAIAGVHLGEPTGREALLKLGIWGDPLPKAAQVVSRVDLVGGEGTLALEQLYEAVRTRATATFNYRSESRRVNVAAIRFARGHWYVVGYDLDRQDGRTFRVDRIEGTPTLSGAGSASLPDGFDAEAIFRIDPWQFGTADEVDVRIAVDRAELGRVLAELGDDALTERLPDGSGIIHMVVNDLEALVSWVVDLLDHAEILEPQEVRQTMITRLERMAGRGAGATS